MAEHSGGKTQRVKKEERALVIAGGGPTAGIGLGVLRAIERHKDEIEFGVWSLSSVGAWLGCLYHCTDKPNKWDELNKLMHEFYRSDADYDKFPCPTVFVPDLPLWFEAAVGYMLNMESYQNLVVSPDLILNAHRKLTDFWSNVFASGKIDRGDFCEALLNGVLAVNPLARFLMGMIWKSSIPGISKLWYGPNYSLLRKLDIETYLAKEGLPVIYHNAYDVGARKLQLFSNRPTSSYPKITAETLSACSGLPFILSPVTIKDAATNESKTYVEGATVDTVGLQYSFENKNTLPYLNLGKAPEETPGKRPYLLENHPELKEIWICRLLDLKEIRLHRNLLEAINNLVMMLASTISEDDVNLFKYDLELSHHRDPKRPKIKVIEFPVANNADFFWSHKNLDDTANASFALAERKIKDYLASTYPATPPLGLRQHAKRGKRAGFSVAGAKPTPASTLEERKGREPEAVASVAPSAAAYPPGPDATRSRESS